MLTLKPSPTQWVGGPENIDSMGRVVVIGSLLMIDCVVGSRLWLVVDCLGETGWMVYDSVSLGYSTVPSAYRANRSWSAL